MRILVTGSSGFIGSHLVRALRESEQEVYGIDLTESEYTDEVADICDFNTNDFDIVYHLAAMMKAKVRIDEFWRVNVEGTKNLLSNFNGRLFIYISTVYSYLRSNPYFKSKYDAERFLMHSDFPWCIVSFTNVYGPNSDKSIVAKLLNRTEGVVCRGDGEQTRDFTYVDDIIVFMTSLLEAQLDAHCQKIYQLHSFEYISLERLMGLTGHRLPKIETHTGFEIKHVPQSIECPTKIREGIERMGNE